MTKTKKEVAEEPLEKKLWKAADKLRKNTDAAEYKHVVLGLIFLKYISDAFTELYNNLKKGKGQYYRETGYRFIGRIYLIVLT
jgi:type I restriction enzyme M protein